jgi:hypothetical protein
VKPFSFLGNVSNFLTSARTELNREVALNGKNKTGTWVKKLDHVLTQAQTQTPTVSNLIGELKKTFETFVADRSRTEPKFMNMSNESNGENKTQPWVEKLDSVLTQAQTQTPTVSHLIGELKKSFETFVADRSRNEPMFMNMSNKPNGKNKTQAWVEGLGRGLEVLTSNLESLKNDVSQIRGRSNSSTDFVRLSEKFDRMFADTLATLSKTTEEQKRLEEKVKIQLNLTNL